MNDIIKKLRLLFSQTKDLGSITGANFIVSAISGVFWFYVATIIDPESYGMISYTIAIASVGAMAVSFGIPNSIIVYGAKKESIHSSLYILSIFSSVSASLILYLFLNNVDISLYLIAIVLFGLVQADLKSRKMYKTFSLQLISQRVILLILGIGLFYVLGNNGIILGMALSYLPFVYRLRVGFSESKFSFSIIKNKFRFMMHDYIRGISGRLDGQIDKLIIAPILGFVTLGNYHLAFQFLMLINVVSISAHQYLLSEESSGTSHRKIKKILILVSICLTLLAIFLADDIIKIIFPNFDEAQNIISILSLAIIPIMVNQILISEFLGNEKSKVVMISGVVSLLTHITFLVILGTLFDEVGIAIAFVLGIISRTTYLLIMKRKMTFKDN